MTVYYSSDFGWSEGQDISDEFIALVANTLQPGDTLVLEGMYQISGENIQPPETDLLFPPYKAPGSILSIRATITSRYC